MLESYGMSERKPLSAPGLGPELSPEQPEGKLLDEVDKKRYHAITGSVMYLTQATCYDIMYATTRRARAMSKPSKAHVAAAKHLLRYLTGTADFRVSYTSEGASNSRRFRWPTVGQ